MMFFLLVTLWFLWITCKISTLNTQCFHTTICNLLFPGAAPTTTTISKIVTPIIIQQPYSLPFICRRIIKQLKINSENLKTKENNFSPKSIITRVKRRCGFQRTTSRQEKQKTWWTETILLCILELSVPTHQNPKKCVISKSQKWILELLRCV